MNDREASSRRSRLGNQGPAETGRNLATLNRGTGEQLRVSLDEYNGRLYLSLRVWSGGYPVRGKGVTVRLAEAEAVSRALLAGFAEAGWPEDDRSARPAGRAGGRGGRPAVVGPFPEVPAPAPRGDGKPFDEFEEAEAN